MIESVFVEFAYRIKLCVMLYNIIELHWPTGKGSGATSVR